MYWYIPMYTRVSSSRSRNPPLSSTSIVGCIPASKSVPDDFRRCLPCKACAVPKCVFKTTNFQRRVAKTAASSTEFPVRNKHVYTPTWLSSTSRPPVSYHVQGGGCLLFPVGNQNSEASASRDTVPCVVAAERRTRLCSGIRKCAPR